MAMSVESLEADRRAFGSRLWSRNRVLAVVLVAGVFVAYQPAWHGGFLWDDNAHVTAPELRSWHGLYRIWFDLKATQQYYPLLHSTFWVEYKVWGGHPLGYHLVNILLHATAALMVAVILRRLAVPGAYLAAAIFALHPVCVESVAWITEQKNTLSAVFYLGAMMAYLRFDQGGRLGTGRFFGGKTCLANQPSAENMDLSPSQGLYVAALGLFVLALLSKTVTATLPAALLVIFWWQRGRLSWRRDVLPLVPFFVLGAISGVFTAWVERKLIGAEGAAFELTIVERFLIAGRVVWFYLGKLFWPANLLFIYPRWQINQALWWQYLFPAAALALVAAFWLLRRRWRGPLAGMLFFVGTLLPVLGFFNVYPFIYSFVADHFQYLASLGIIVLASAGIALLLTRLRIWNQPAGYALCVALLATLATLTWRQSRIYADEETLYRQTITVNPECWLACNNLGIMLAERGEFVDAIAYYRKALASNPDCANARVNLGSALDRQGDFDEALAQCEKALEIRANYALAHCALAVALQGQDRTDEAVAHYEMALLGEPAYAHAQAHTNLGAILGGQGKADEAILHFRKALEINPQYLVARQNLDLVLSQQDQAIKELARLQDLIRAIPNDATLMSDAAWLMATSPFASVRNGQRALELAQRALLLAGERKPRVLATLAAACAEAGRFSEAVQTVQKALGVATEQGIEPVSVASLKAQLSRYQAGLPYRQKPLPSAR